MTYRTHQILDAQKTVTHASWHAANRGLLAQISHEQQEVIAVAKQRQRVEACKSLKKLVCSAFERHVRIAGFLRWLGNIRDKDKKIRSLDR